MHTVVEQEHRYTMDNRLRKVTQSFEAWRNGTPRIYFRKSWIDNDIEQTADLAIFTVDNLAWEAKRGELFARRVSLWFSNNQLAGSSTAQLRS